MVVGVETWVGNVAGVGDEGIATGPVDRGVGVNFANGWQAYSSRLAAIKKEWMASHRTRNRMGPILLQWENDLYVIDPIIMEDLMRLPGTNFATEVSDFIKL
jgi:hypothetical protein